MADQTYWFPEVVKDVMIQIEDYYVPTDFMVLDMRNEEGDDYIILGRPFLNTTGAIIYMRSGEIHFQFPKEKVRCYFNSYTNTQQDKKNHSRRRRQRNNKGGEITKSGDTSSKKHEGWRNDKSTS